MGNTWSKLDTQGKLHVSTKVAARRKTKKVSASKTRCTVYGLSGADGVICYIGQTRTDTETRLNYHKRSAFTGGASPVAQWIFANSDDVSIIALDENATWNVSEILIIDRYRRKGQHLWNVTRGGDDTLADVRREDCFPESHKELALAARRAKSAQRADELGIMVCQSCPRDLTSRITAKGE
jgi:hypothetical protein